MDILKNLKDELTEEYHTTRKFLNNFPANKNDYVFQDKSRNLTNHIVDFGSIVPFTTQQKRLENLEM